MSQQSYSFWSRVIHRLALGSNAVAKASFDMERTLHRVRESDVTNMPHVFVTGLARAGTTILMRQLHETGAYRSLTYRDMPFVLAPNTWARISSVSRKEMEAEERAHGDGILVNFDSPEALEEVFWRVTCGGDYIRKDRLVPMSIDEEVEADFRDYISLLLMQHHGKCYLSKNNNNILRLHSLIQCFPNAIVLIPFREPLQQAYSLMRQHQLFVERHSEEPFSRDYMTWLVHHEFGQDHRPFEFDEPRSADTRRSNSPTELSYWLQLWLDTYEFIAATAPESCMFLSYERLCDDVETVWPRLCSSLNLPQKPPSESLQRSHQAVGIVPDELSERAAALYETLREQEVWR